MFDEHYTPLKPEGGGSGNQGKKAKDEMTELPIERQAQSFPARVSGVYLLHGDAILASRKS